MLAASDRRAASSKNVEYAVTFKSGCADLGLTFKETNGACVVDEVEPESKVIPGSLVTGGNLFSIRFAYEVASCIRLKLPPFFYSPFQRSDRTMSSGSHMSPF